MIEEHIPRSLRGSSPHQSLYTNSPICYPWSPTSRRGLSSKFSLTLLFSSSFPSLPHRYHAFSGGWCREHGALWSIVLCKSLLVASPLVLSLAFPCGRKRMVIFRSIEFWVSLNPDPVNKKEMTRPTATAFLTRPRSRTCSFPKDSILRGLTSHWWLFWRGRGWRRKPLLIVGSIFTLIFVQVIWIHFHRNWKL